MTIGKSERIYNYAGEILMFLLSPILALPYLIYGVKKGKYGNLVLISLCMALFAFITPPFADLYNHTMDYIKYKQTPDTGSYFQGGYDFILYTISNFFAHKNIPFEYVRAIFTFVSYQISFFLFKEIIKKNLFSSESTKFFLFLIFFLSVPFIWVVNGLRMATACYIAVFSWYYIYERKSWFLAIILYVCSICLHFGSLMFFPVILYSLFPVFKISKTWFVIISLICVIAGGILLNLLPVSLIQMLGMDSNVEYYMKNTQYFDDVMSVNGLIAMYVERLPILVGLYYILFRRISMPESDKSLLYIVFIMFFLFQPFTILFQKFSLFIIPLMLYLLVPRLNFKQILSMMVSCIILSLAYLYGYRDIFFATPFYLLFITPFYTLFTTDTIENLKNAVIPN